MVITEIFKSIQGESSFAGLPCVFVRLTGCNLRCQWCDTAYAFYGGEKMTSGQVLERVRELGGTMVELTGGEPLLQKETIGLADNLLAEGYQVLIETSGERYVGDLARPVVKIIDVKCPGSGESGKFNLANLDVLERKDQIKFVVLDEKDYLFARDFMQAHRLTGLVDEIIFSPVFGQLSPLPLAQWILRDNLNVRMGLQIHKFIWDPDMRGV